MHLLIFSLIALPVQAGVSLGSYGRAQVSTDLQGGQGDAVNVVTWPTRLEKDPYLELDFVFGRELEDGARFDIVVTPAVEGELFHYDGEWDADLAMRNLYVEATDFTALPLGVWAGSRMYRGDDVHLFDFWPLDEVNTVGGGAELRPSGWEFAMHAGLNRLTADQWQVQYYDVPEEGGLGTESVLYMDRQRLIASAKAARLFEGDKLTWRLKAYAELQTLPEATRLVDDWEEQVLPRDRGTVLGAQLSAWGWAHDSFAHLFLRHASGLGTLGELTVPNDGLAWDLTYQDASEYLAAFSANHEGDRLGLLAGGYLRRFEDADGIDVDVDDRWEAAVALRPTLFTSEHTSIGLELSQQWLRPDGLNPHSRQHDVPMITKIALLPAIQPGPGSLSRPQVRLQYIVSLLNDDARLWFDDRDQRHRANVQHFLGVGAEWWINSRSYR